MSDKPKMEIKVETDDVLMIGPGQASYAIDPIELIERLERKLAAAERKLATVLEIGKRMREYAYSYGPAMEWDQAISELEREK